MRPARIAVVAVLLAVIAFSAPLSAADTTVLRAEAGLNGLSKPGRWTPVRIRIDHDGPDLIGEVVVQWGDAVVHRQIALVAPARSQFDIYLRTLDVRDAISVRLRANGGDVRSVSVPIRVVPPDEQVTLCAVSEEAFANEISECTITIAREALPLSVRGYDAVDRVVWRAGPDELLAPAQQTALTGWRAYHLLEASDMLSRAPRLTPVTPSPDGSQSSLVAVGTVVGLYALTIGVLSTLARRSGRRPLFTYAAVAFAAFLGSSITLAAGRIGPASSVGVRYRSTLLELADGASLISMRGVTDYPAFDSFQIRTDVADASLESLPRTHSEAWFDENANPVLEGVAGLGSSREFALEGIVGFSPLKVETRAGAARITNTSRADLHDCSFPYGFSIERVGLLRAGEAVEARRVSDVDTPFFACTLVEAPVAFTDARYPVQVKGESLVSVYLPSGVAERARQPTP